jgi:hypothetical protein
LSPINPILPNYGRNQGAEDRCTCTGRKDWNVGILEYWKTLTSSIPLSHCSISFLALVGKKIGMLEYWNIEKLGFV